MTFDRDALKARQEREWQELEALDAEQERLEKEQARAVEKSAFLASSDVFELEPVPLAAWVSDAEGLANPELSPIQFEVVRHLEQIYLPETYDELTERATSKQDRELWQPVRYINFAWIQWGKGSGKDHVCRIANARWIYLLQCLKDPQAYFGMPAQDWIHTLNVAASATQAGRAYFEPLRGLIRHAPCFKDKYQTVFGDEPGKASMKFSKNLEMVSGHSRASTLEGLNIIGGIADEISEFKTDSEAEHLAKAGRPPSGTYEAILKMIRTSARTRFSRNFKLAAISYPRFKGDAIQQLCLRGRDDNARYGMTWREWREKGELGQGPSRVLVSGPWSTWDVNPRVPDIEAFREDYDEDPGMARAMYECEPSLATNRLYRNDVAVHAAFDEQRPDPIVVEYYWGKDETAREESAWIPEERDGWQVRFHFSDQLFPMRGAMYSLHGDLARNGDRAGIAMAHVRQQKLLSRDTPDGEALEPRDVVRVDAVLSFEADVSLNPPREVQLRWYRKLIWELMARGFYVARATADGWQSADTLQILESRGIEAKVVSMDRDTKAWDNLRDVMYDGRLEGYWRPTMVTELLSLMRLPNGKVDHPSGGSKDEADALAGAVWGAIELGGSEGEEPERADQAMDDVWSAAPSAAMSTLGFGGEGGLAFGGEMSSPAF